MRANASRIRMREPRVLGTRGQANEEPHGHLHTGVALGGSSTPGESGTAEAPTGQYGGPAVPLLKPLLFYPRWTQEAFTRGTLKFWTLNLFQNQPPHPLKNSPR